MLGYVRNTLSKVHCVFLFILLLVFMIIVPAQRAEALEGDALPINENGVTYGSMFLAQVKSNAEMPELVSAIASNGRVGYMYYEDYLRVVRNDFMLTPEVAAARISAKQDKLATAMKDAAKSHYGLDLLTTEEIKQALDFSIRTNGEEAARSVLNQAIDDAIQRQAEADCWGDVEQIDERFAELRASASKSADESLVLHSIACDASKLAISNRLIPGAGYCETATLMTPADYWVIFNEAKAQVGQAIAVYDIEGEVQIGEVIVDCL